MCKAMHIIPTPLSINKKVSVERPIRPYIWGDTRFDRQLRSFAEYIMRIFGISLFAGRGGIEVIYNEKFTGEEYSVSVRECVCVSAGTERGIACGLATVLQLFQKKNGTLYIDEVEIKDRPVSGYRGLMLDLARKRHTVDQIKTYIDICFYFKIKYLQLHFTDDQSYTLPSDVMPKICTTGAAYTRMQIADICVYAQNRGIILVPEIDIPGHARPFIQAYPEIFSNNLSDGRTQNAICIGHDLSRPALKALIREVADMFPESPLIHIGGDEADLQQWADCPRCNAYMKRYGLADVHALYCQFIREMTDYVLSLGRIPVVWEGFGEQYMSEISRSVLVIAWESLYCTPDRLLAGGFTVINASWEPLYIVPCERGSRKDWRYGDVLQWDMFTWRNWWEKSKAAISPIRVSPKERVIGGQLCVWECSFEEAAERVIENLAALSERTWAADRSCNSEIFVERLAAARGKLRCLSDILW